MHDLGFVWGCGKFMFEHQVKYPVCTMDHRIFGAKGTTEALKQNRKELTEDFEDFIHAVGLRLFYIHSTKSSLVTGNFYPDQVSTPTYQFQVPSDTHNVNVPWELDSFDCYCCFMWALCHAKSNWEVCMGTNQGWDETISGKPP